ncbi:hypothetical protein MPY17_30615 [Rhodococcus opacus]|uniref:hypothetical protein n=1 Tax=Rhodococcus opacus TaxID=37919 RepID=UPI001FF56E0C|nr:hypothetical protein [Rhodococcus opacus]UOT03257.1 hypothetical protein MPY17_30615 [Rhodococcus opacus]
MTTTEQTYGELLRWAYLGECFGATFLQELLDTDAFPAHRHHLQLLVELETVTARLLEPLISGHELDDDRRQTATQAGEYARNMVKLTWGGFLTETRTIAAEALPRFRQLAVQGPDRTRATLSAVVEHEEVLLGFAELSLAANPQAADALVRNYLRRHSGGSQHHDSEEISMTTPVTTAPTKLTAAGLERGGVQFQPLSEVPDYAAFVDTESVDFAHLSGDFGQPGEVAAMKIEHGGFRYTNLPCAESGFVLSGTAEISDGTTTLILTAGEGYLLPKGWSGTFLATEPVLKVFYVL